MPKAELLLCLCKHVLPETVPVPFHGIAGQKNFESSGSALLLTPTSNPELDLDTLTHLPPELHPVGAGSSPAFSLGSQPQPLAFSSLSTQLSLSQIASLLCSIRSVLEPWAPMGLPGSSSRHLSFTPVEQLLLQPHFLCETLQMLPLSFNFFLYIAFFIL